MTRKKIEIKEIDFYIFAVVLTLTAFGMIMVFSASSWFAMIKAGDIMFYFKKQAFFGILGVISMIFFTEFDYHKFRKWATIGFFGTLPLLLVTMFFKETNGAHRWILLGPLSFQPSELVKYTMALYFAHRMAKNGDEIKKYGNGVLYYLVMVGIVAALLLKQPNMSIAAVCIFVTFIMLYIAGAEMKHLMITVIPVFVALVGLILTSSYRLTRALTFLDPWQDSTGAGYQLIQSFLALGTGGITGVGFGYSRQKAFYMPEPHNDFILSIIGEELGLIGCTFVVILFIFFLYRGIKVAMSAKDIFGTLLAVGIVSIIAIQAVINIAVVTGSMPVTGVPLPFISYGGTALFINLSAMGVLLNISRQCIKTKVKTREELIKI